MKLSLKTLLIFLMFNLTANAFDANEKLYSFIGVQASQTKYDSASTTTMGLKYGVQNSKWRTAIAYNYAEKSGSKFQSIVMQMDKGVLTELFRDLPLKPYLGFSLALMQDKNSELTDRGFLYGINTGFNYVLNDSFDIDFGYRYMIAKKFKNVDNRVDILISLHYYFD